MVGSIGIGMDVSTALSRNDCCTALITPGRRLRWANGLFTREVGDSLSNLDHFLSLDEYAGTPIAAVIQKLQAQKAGACCLRGTWIKDCGALRRVTLSIYSLREPDGESLGYLVMIEAADSFIDMQDGDDQMSFQAQDEIIRLRHAILG